MEDVIDNDELEVDLGQEEEGDDTALEKKYADQMRQIFPQKIELPISALVGMVAAQIELAPDFQRRDVWDDKKRSKFIESIIMNVPIPPVFMGEDKYSKYVVLDGRQRLTAIVRYLKNEFALDGLHVWTELNGKRFSELEAEGLDVTITRRFLPAVLLLKESSPEVKYDVFERLNTGGLNLNAMEIRNAVYRGKFTELLHTCASSKNFRTLWDIPHSDSERKDNKLYTRMVDLELVLRFFALSEAQDNPSTTRPAFKTYLSAFMKDMNRKLEGDSKLIEATRKRFELATGNCLALLGEAAFRPTGRKERSAPFADAILYACAHIEPSAVQKSAVQKRAVETLDGLQSTNGAFKEAMATGTNGRAKIETRLREARKALDQAVAEAG